MRSFSLSLGTADRTRTCMLRIRNPIYFRYSTAAFSLQVHHINVHSLWKLVLGPLRSWWVATSPLLQLLWAIIHIVGDHWGSCTHVCGFADRRQSCSLTKWPRRLMPKIGACIAVIYSATSPTKWPTSLLSENRTYYSAEVNYSRIKALRCFGTRMSRQNSRCRLQDLGYVNRLLERLPAMLAVVTFA